MSDIELWTDKYHPKEISDIIGQKEIIHKFENWLQHHQAGDTDIERCILLTGNSGLGKSSSATCILKNYGYLIYEFNASDIRTKTQVEQSLYNLINIKQARGRSPIAIIMDEIDGGDKGGLTELIKYINPNRGKGNRKKEDQEKLLALPPIICICNNVNEKKLQDLRKDCLELHFKTPNNQDLHELLDRICQAEHLNIEPEAAELVIEYSQGDFRRLITYLQSIDSLLIDNNLVLGVDEIEQCNYIIGEKSMDMDLAEGVRYLLTTKNLDPEFSLKLYQNHKSQYICSIYENYVNLAINQFNRSGAEIVDFTVDFSYEDLPSHQ